MKYIVIFGPPGSGKGTQSDNIIMKYGYAHISTGDVLRAEISANTELGQQAKGFINQGQLVPDTLIVDMLAATLDKTETSAGVIFDGFPRTTPQAAALKEMLKKRGGDVNVMLSLEVEREELISRLLKRGETSGRADDSLETIEKRIAVYNEQTTPVIKYYQAEGSYVSIKGIGTVAEIFERIEVALA